MSDDPLQISLAILIVIGGALVSALATAAETSLLTLRMLARHTVQPSADSPLIRSLIQDQDRLALSLRAANYGAKIAAAVALAALFARLLPITPLAAYAIAGVLSLMLAIILAEILPKSLPEESAPTVSQFLAPFTWIIVIVLYPLIAGHLWLARRLDKQPEADNGDGPEANVSEIELRALLSLGEVEGVIEEDTRDIIEGIFTFGDQVAAEIMTPRSELFALSLEDLDDPEEIASLRQRRHSRALIYRDNIDHIVGYLDRKAVLLNPDAPPASLVTEPLFVPETRRLMDLLADMKRCRVHFAVVIDEYGGTAGVVTLADMLNEIVGELEQDAMGRRPIVPRGEGEWLVSGRLELEELEDQLGLALPDESVHTVSGFIMSRLERHPAPGDVVEEDPVRLTVTRMGARRVAQARLEVAPDANGAGRNGKNGKNGNGKNGAAESNGREARS